MYCPKQLVAPYCNLPYSLMQTPPNYVLLRMFGTSPLVPPPLQPEQLLPPIYSVAYIVGCILHVDLHVSLATNKASHCPLDVGYYNVQVRRKSFFV